MECTVDLQCRETLFATLEITIITNMQLYQVNGTVTLSRVHPSFVGCSLKTAEAYGERLLGRTSVDPDLVVIWDDLGATNGSIVAVSDGAEAAQPFRPQLKPVDAYNAAIIDEFQIRREKREPRRENQELKTEN